MSIDKSTIERVAPFCLLMIRKESLGIDAEICELIYSKPTLDTSKKYGMATVMYVIAAMGILWVFFCRHENFVLRHRVCVLAQKSVF